MPPLHSDLRKSLEKAVIAAREQAQTAAASALKRLAVASSNKEVPKYLSDPEKKLRVKLRAKARQLGDPWQADKETFTALPRLTHDVAYEHWHRMLFARFLAENDLLVHPQHEVPVSLSDLADLAQEEAAAMHSRPDKWAIAERFAALMLPQIFRPDDPALAVPLAPEHQQALEAILESLPAAAFTADDSLGWVYQFWQSAEKDRVNAAGQKITSETVSAVTQLFTEHYMVLFLLHNTLGAWWAGKEMERRHEGTKARRHEGAQWDEASLRKLVALPGLDWEYLRFVRNDAASSDSPTSDPSSLRASVPSCLADFRPAAGTFPGWPRTAKEIKLLDPCCGSGHFLVAALDILTRLRIAEENLSLRDAIDAVLRDNLHGLELDPRCTQIAAFNLALAAWKLGGGYWKLPGAGGHIACTGIAPSSSLDDWLKLVDAAHQRRRIPTLAREPIKAGLTCLYDLFAKAPTLGSLIDPNNIQSNLIQADFATLQPILADALAGESNDDEVHERAVAAQGMVKAAEMLAGEYTLVVTNVPFRQADDLDEKFRTYAAKYFDDAKADIATVFYCRLQRFLASQGTSAAVLPQGFLYKDAYSKLRRRLFSSHTFHVVARLGAGAFREITGEEVKVCLVVAEDLEADRHGVIHQYLASSGGIDEKDRALRMVTPLCVPSRTALISKKFVLVGDQQATVALLDEDAEYSNGIQTGDYPRFGRCIWEIVAGTPGWEFQLSTVENSSLFAGREHCLLWEQGEGALIKFIEAKVGPTQVKSWVRGLDCRDRLGIAISAMGVLKATLYTGELFDDNTVVIIPNQPSNLKSLWAFCSDETYDKVVRMIDQSSKVRGALLRVPFDLAHWQQVAAEKYPNGLPEPESDDPTQWLFHGRPEAAAPGSVLQVAVARLLGYRWPAELDESMRLSPRARELVKRCETLLPFADDDGVVPVVPINQEPPADQRLRTLLETAYRESGEPLTPARLADLIAEAGSPGKSLEEWIRTDFFAQHCAMFHQRPFIWQIWDGKKDGFSVLVHYHRLAAPNGEGRRLLEKITYTYLGDWINQQKKAAAAGTAGADVRIRAATELQTKLEAIIHGEPPYDIFVRWKPLHQQPMGWEPDINDGVRLNIRPFIEAGVLRGKVNVNWKKDRGAEPQSLRPKKMFPWFWGWDEKTQDFTGGNDFTGERFNALHYTNAAKEAARNQAKEEEWDAQLAAGKLSSGKKKRGK